MGKFFDKTRIDYLVEILQPERRTRIVDVGANPINYNPYLNLLKAGHCKVWGFEPNPVAFERLTSTDTETYLPYAIGDGKPGTLYVTKAPALTSLYPPNKKVTGFLGRMGRPSTVLEEVKIKTHALDEMKDLPDFDLLKIDVEGGEVQVFKGAREKLSRAVAVISEVAFLPLNEGQPLLDVQMKTLRGHGFDLHKFVSMSAFSVRGGLASKLHVKRHGNQMLNGDAAFLRSLLTPDNISNEQLKHIAILCDGVLESFDFAIRCLDILIARGVITPDAAMGYIKQLPHLAD